MLSALAGFVENLLQPVGLVWLVLVIATGRFLSRGEGRAALWTLLPALWLFLLGSTPLPAWLLARLERPYLRPVAAIPKTDAVVMLGGTHYYTPHTPLPLNFGDSVDRPLTAIELVRRGHARALVLGGSHYRYRDQARPDAELLKVWFEGWHLPTGELHLLGICANTHDEARRTAALLAAKRWRTPVLRVNTAAHLRRAEATFRRAGVPVYAVGCDFAGSEALEADARWSLVPQSRGLDLFRAWLHEELGWWFYRLRGWA
jgi:uncharacterized SAM-binding protein YcdF (DUF218 family)